MSVERSSSMRRVRSKQVFTSVGVFFMSEMKRAMFRDEFIVDATVETIAVVVAGSGMLFVLMTEEIYLTRKYRLSDFYVGFGEMRLGCPLNGA